MKALTVIHALGMHPLSPSMRIDHFEVLAHSEASSGAFSCNPLPILIGNISSGGSSGVQINLRVRVSHCLLLQLIQYCRSRWLRDAVVWLELELFIDRKYIWK